jgi:hypothetical protein
MRTKRAAAAAGIAAGAASLLADGHLATTALVGSLFNLAIIFREPLTRAIDAVVDDWRGRRISTWIDEHAIAPSKEQLSAAARIFAQHEITRSYDAEAVEPSLPTPAASLTPVVRFLPNLPAAPASAADSIDADAARSGPPGAGRTRR